MTSTAKSAGTSSTVSPEMRGLVRHDEKKFEPFRRLDRRRRAAGLSVGQLVAAAGTGERGYRYAHRGIKLPRLSTMRALEAALDALVRQRDHEVEVKLIALWRSMLSAVALDLGLVPTDVLAADPRANLKGDERWVAAAQARHRAAYLLVTVHNVPMAQAAAVAGVTKQAISKAMRRVEDGREDPLRDRAIEMLSEALAVPA